MTRADGLSHADTTNDAQQRALVVRIGAKGHAFGSGLLLQVLKAWHVAEDVLVVVDDCDSTELPIDLLVGVESCGAGLVLHIILSSFVAQAQGRFYGRKGWGAVQGKSLLRLNNLLDRANLFLGFLKFDLGFSNCVDNALRKVLLLNFDHFVADCAEVEQVEDVDFQELVVRQLLEGVLELSLLAAQVSPERILELRSEVNWCVRLQKILSIFDLIYHLYDWVFRVLVNQRHLRLVVIAARLHTLLLNVALSKRRDRLARVLLDRRHVRASQADSNFVSFLRVQVYRIQRLHVSR